jgi:hypothetical protein
MLPGGMGSQFLLHTSSMEPKFWPAVPRVGGWFFGTDMIRISTKFVVDLNKIHPIVRNSRNAKRSLTPPTLMNTAKR